MRFPFIGAAVAAAIAFASPALADVRLTGSGASFPFPLYSAWFKDFSSKSDGVTVDYQSKGSGAGIQDFINKVVDFAASDAAMKDEDIAKVQDGAVLLPMTAGEIVVIYNLPGVGKLKLPRDVYPEIFLGNITKWNDERIASANPGVELPDTPITVVVRSIRRARPSTSPTTLRRSASRSRRVRVRAPRSPGRPAATSSRRRRMTA